RPPEVVPAPVAPPPPPPVTPAPPGLPLWAKATIMTASGAALIAAIAWMVSVFSNKSPQPSLQAAIDSIRTDSIRADSIRRANEAAATLTQTAPAVDSAT